MAQPIRSTPTLAGKEAELLVETMIKTVKRRPNSIEEGLADDILSLKD